MNLSTNTLYIIQFVDRFVQGVVSQNIFRQNCGANQYSEYVSISDEAMTFLILASDWEEMAEWIVNNPKGTKVLSVAECTKKQLYLIDGKGRGYSWSAAGKEYYNTMYNNIIKDRIMNPEFDSYFKNAVIEQEEEKEKKKDKQKYPLHDLVDHRNIRCRNDNSVRERLAAQETNNMPDRKSVV